jgi:hypothetical protein
MRLLLLCAVALGALASPLASQDRLVVGDFSVAGADGKPAPWRLFTHAGKADLSLVRDGDIAAVDLKSRSSSFGLEREANVDLGRYPVLTWKWKATVLPAGGDFRRGGRDDQAAQLYVAFGRTRAIGYIWDTSAPAGTEGQVPGLPPFVSVKLVVLRSGSAETGRWLAESRNVLEDYRRLFGGAKDAPVAKGLRILVNSQHTGTEAEGSFADIAFEGAAGEGASERTR